MDSTDRLRRIGIAAADRVQDGMVVGLGTGSTAASMVDALGKRVANGLRCTGVATSIATERQATALGIPMRPLDAVDQLDLCIDGADEIDPHLHLVKGRGGALLYEKLVARTAREYLIIASSEKLVARLGDRMALPVEVVPMGWMHTARRIAATGLEPAQRMNGSEPFVTDGGHFIVDCAWPSGDAVDPVNLANTLKAITGVVDHGLFIGMATEALTIDEDGVLTSHTPAHS